MDANLPTNSSISVWSSPGWCSPASPSTSPRCRTSRRAGSSGNRQASTDQRRTLITSEYPRSGSSSGSGVRCIINLANWSMFTMLDVETNTECGRTNKDFPPRNVFPGYRCGVQSIVTIKSEKSVRKVTKVPINEVLWIFHPTRALQCSLILVQ